MDVRALFDEASEAWRENKIVNGGGTFSYKCIYIHSNGKPCNKASVNAEKTYCKQHMRRHANGVFK